MGTLETQRGPDAAQCEFLSHPDKLFRPLNEELHHGVVVQGLSEPLQNEDGSSIIWILLFPGLLGTFITRCPDSDKSYKHSWFFAAGRWLHGQLLYGEVPFGEGSPLHLGGVMCGPEGYIQTRGV